MKLLRKFRWPFPARTVNNLQAILMMEQGMTARPIFSCTRKNENTNKSENKMPQVMNEFMKMFRFSAELAGWCGVVTLRMINLNTRNMLE